VKLFTIRGVSVASQPWKKGVDHSRGVLKLKGSSEQEVPMGDVSEMEEREDDAEDDKAGCSNGTSDTEPRDAFLRDAWGKSDA
jgi:hypothetical protein